MRAPRRKLHIATISLFVIGVLLFVFSFTDGSDREIVSAPEKPTISFALCGDMAMQKIVDEVVNVFTRVYDCEVDVYCFSSDKELREKIIGQFAAGKPFDVFCPDSETLDILISKDKLCSLDAIVESRGLDGDDFYSAALLCGRQNEIQYALPTGVMPYLIYYNRSCFENAGVDSPSDYMREKNWNAESFERCISELNDASGMPVVGLSGSSSDDPAIPGNLRQISGCSLKAENADALTIRAPFEELIQGFIDGSIPMIVCDLTMTQKIKSNCGFEWDIVPYPSENSDFSNSVFKVPMIAAADNSSRELSRQFIDFYVSGIGQKLRLEHGECLLPSLNMTFYTSMGDVIFPNHSNYYFFAIEYGRAVNR